MNTTKSEPRCKHCGQPKVAHTAILQTCPHMVDGKWTGYEDTHYEGLNPRVTCEQTFLGE